MSGRDGRADIQGNILRGYGSHAHAAYAFTQVTDPGAARALLRRLRPDVACERDWKQRPASRINVAFTHAGLRALSVPAGPFAGYEDFRAGMYARARPQLGDLGANDPAHWDPRLTDRAHVLFTIYGHDEATRDGEAQRLRDQLAKGGMALVHLQTADMRTDSREHFGFRDGFSQPALAGVSANRRALRGEGAARPAWRRLLGDQWRPIRLGEFVLGHRDEDGVVPGAGHPLLRNGTFMVWRKLEQDVEAFETWVRAWAGPDDHAQKLLKARVVGRWPGGASLVRRPPAGRGRPGRAAVPERERQPAINDFLYGDDAAGLRCPLGAHVRRANPRDALGFRTERTRRNRIIRRGMPYVDETPPSRGLIFVCFNASIARQFEQVQGNWLMSGDTFGLGDDRDFLTGGLDDAEQTTRMTIQGDRSAPPVVVTRDRQFVTVRGGYYLFVPGLNALKLISEAG